MIKKTIIVFTFIVGAIYSINAQNQLPTRGFCIEAPGSNNVDRFVTFIDTELASRGVNTLVLRIDYNYQFKSYPELGNNYGLSENDVKKLVKCCQQNSIKLIPQINLLGHQSWAEGTGKLLQVYPQFDETPWVKMPKKYEWPNADGLYCKSYCPLHPNLHKIIFALVDEICTVFEADAFHAGMDEVFYIGDDKCPRCGGRDRAELFAGEVNKIQNHLSLKGRQLWIWGDRLIDGKITGIGEWEASTNNTHPAIDLISKDVMICDWHYERADQTPVYFAMKGFSVITCVWKNADLAIVQANDMLHFRKNATNEMKNRYSGMMQTIWSGSNAFLNEFYSEKNLPNSESYCFKELFKVIGSE